jgi:hexulose-6-phosphate isomerase
MKKSINIWSFPAEWSLEEKVKVAAAAGFEGFEPDLTEDGPLNLGSTAAEIREVARLIRSHGLEVSALATGLYWGANGASEKVSTRKRAARIMKKQIETAARLETDSILVIPAAVGADFIPDCEVVPYDVAWERATELIGGALPLAEKRGVTLSIENVWNKFLLSPLEMAHFIDQFDHPIIGAYFDAGNALATGYPEQWIRVLGDRISRVHFKDYRRAVGSVDGFVDLLSGDVDWPAVMAELRTVGYNGWCAAEMIPPMPFYKHCPEILIENTARALDGIFAL